MKLSPTVVAGCVLVELEPMVDERGFFARSFAAEEFEAAGLEPVVAHGNISFNYRAGTVRGLHRLIPPHAEAKLVRCTRGAMVDVAVDVRDDSPTFGKHVMVELTADNRLGLFVPAYVLHGFQTLVDDTEVTYLVSRPFVPEAERSHRWNDPAFGIAWPLEATVISEKDSRAPLWNGRPMRSAPPVPRSAPGPELDGGPMVSAPAARPT
jgi:dTDP-4-dehydrorhamnose 3,5-epimerase